MPATFCTMSFREVENPEEAAATGRYTWFGTYTYIFVWGIPIGGYDRFTEELNSHLVRYFPDFHLGNDLKIYHPKLPRDFVADSIRKIELYCIGWAGYDEVDKTPQ